MGGVTAGTIIPILLSLIVSYQIVTIHRGIFGIYYSVYIAYIVVNIAKTSLKWEESLISCTMFNQQVPFMGGVAAFSLRDYRDLTYP